MVRFDCAPNQMMMARVLWYGDAGAVVVVSIVGVFYGGQDYEATLALHEDQ